MTPEDVAPYPGDALAELAVRARAFLSEPRKPGDPARLRLSDTELVRDGRSREVTIVEVINDNRPFLLDSTLAELTEQGLTPDLVAHPILGVERDASGALVRVVGETTAGGAHPVEVFALTDRLQADLDYVGDWSLRRDVAIIAGTLTVMLHPNAY